MAATRGGHGWTAGAVTQRLGNETCVDGSAFAFVDVAVTQSYAGQMPDALLFDLGSPS